jgi:hypothetical protein
MADTGVAGSRFSRPDQKVCDHVNAGSWFLLKFGAQGALWQGSNNGQDHRPFHGL